METFTDYYTVLGVDTGASSDTIKAAFKKLALQYHPDVYKGEDAEERMRLILLAYQTLSDPEARKHFDRQRAGHLGYAFDGAGASPRAAGSNSAAASAAKKKEQNGRFAFPDLEGSGPVEFVLEGFTYTLWLDDALLLRQQGMLRGNAPHPRAAQGASSQILYACHRCQHRWNIAGKGNPPAACPSCHARDWADYLLLRCAHCHAVFESRELSDKLRGGQLYNPYELFPLCPNCRRPQWCPAEDARVSILRAAEARRRAIMLIGVTVVALLVLGALALAFAR
ncbi:MAG TPA: DnaJ domain-containing protein [Ktedonobacteraceae bacterium]|nr:DnaJ domain-containing protein [Ktedonobacteraceae bacterium]